MSRRFLSFTVLSLVGMLLVSILLTVVFKQVNRSSLESHFHEHNMLLARILRNGLVNVRLPDLLIGNSDIQNNNVLLSAFESELRGYLRDVPVAKIKIFNNEGITVYSSTLGEAGRDAKSNPGVFAALNGLSTGSMVHRDRFNSFDAVIEDRDLYQQYIPIRASGIKTVEGVFEIYSDVTPLLEDINNTERKFLLGLVAILGTFFLGQIWIYHHTDSALVREKAQTEGYLHELESIREELELRVEVRTKELESSRYFLQSIIDGIANPLFVIQRDLQISMMNRAARCLVGENTPPERYTHCYQISHRRDTPCNGADHPCSFNEVIQTGSTVTVQHNHFDVNGKPMILDIVSTPLHGKNGELQGIIEVQHDVTELAQARQELAQSEARLQAIIDHVPDAIFTLDSDGLVESMNQAALHMFNQEPMAILGSEFRSLFCGELQSLLSESEQGVREICALRAVHDRFPVDLWTGELSLGKERRYVAVVRDITERNRAEQELERTRKQYYHQEKMAAIGQLAAGILHEVGNPIAAIAGAAQDMRSAKEGEVKNNKDDSLVKVVDRNLMLIEEHTERLAKITRDIAEFASPRIDKRVLTDINGLIRSTARLLGYDRRFRNIKLHQMLDSQLPAVQAVPDQITQVLMNLVINALDAAVSSKQSVPIVEIISNLVDGGVEIEVRDNGTG
ncbi:MAG: PAS domain S-box protein, partial [Candidatus Thiodiazotropha sp. (ex Lucinoma borealis)]|nr:PAS domain S-box protein [Candidatus Thiodiazotropha sp. (ex Lucinoma borealis)]